MLMNIDQGKYFDGSCTCCHSYVSRGLRRCKHSHDSRDLIAWCCACIVCNNLFHSVAMKRQVSAKVNRFLICPGAELQS